MGYAAIAMSLFQSYGQASAEKAMGEYQNSMAQINARYAEEQAKYAIERGDKEASNFLKNASSLLGTQRVGFAASGVDVSYGSAQMIQQQTRELSQEDAETIRSNAFMEALGYKHQASEYLRAGELSQSTGRGNAIQTMLGGGLRAYNMYKQLM